MSQITAIWVAWAVACAGLSVWLLAPPPYLARLRTPRQRWSGTNLPAWLQPHPGAMPVGRRWLIGTATGVGVILWGWDFGPFVVLAGMLATVVTAFGLGRLEQQQARAAQSRLRQQVPGGLTAIAACLEAGLPLRQATAAVARLSPPDLAARLGTVVTGVEVGLSDAEAWQGLTADPVLGTIARDISRAADWGTTLSGILIDAAAELQRQVEAEAKTRARAVGVRTVLPLGLCYLPAFILLGVVPVLVSGVLSVLTG